MLHVRDIPYRALPAGLITREQNVVWLDSDGSDPCGRYSYICLWPFRQMQARQGSVSVDHRVCPGDPLTQLREELQRWTIQADHAPVPFIGGACGFMGYHLAGPPDHRPSAKTTSGFADMALNFYDIILAFDHELQKAWVLSSGFPETEPQARNQRALERADGAIRWLEQSEPAPLPVPTLSWQPELSRARYQERIERVLAYIRDGDIFQANLSLRFLAKTPGGFDAGAYFMQHRRTNPAPFAAFLRMEDGLALASFSPERFLSLTKNGHIETRPIKGSARRGIDEAEDRVVRQALAASRKDRAENLMIADLMRNDLGRVAVSGSVRVPQLHQVESFAAIHHLVSVVEAQLQPGLDAIDLLRATFPGGSITGAPKIRAMEIIDELEPAQRGAYCGSIGWFGFDGAMDTSITIRTLTATPDRLIVQAGGAIVADSDADAEYEEMLLKAAPLLNPVS